MKYAEVAIRYPEGGGVVTVGAHAIHPVAGLVGGLFILVDYFLTSALSALSGLIYLSVFAPDLIGIVTLLTVVALVLLAGLNLIGINADAKVTAVIAVVALGSQLAVVIAVLIHAGFGTALGAIPKTLSGPRISPIGLLTGYAGAFLAFSGLESISQLAPAMRRPQRLVRASRDGHCRVHDHHHRVLCSRCGRQLCSMHTTSTPISSSPRLAVTPRAPCSRLRSRRVLVSS